MLQQSWQKAGLGRAERGARWEVSVGSPFLTQKRQCGLLATDPEQRETVETRGRGGRPRSPVPGSTPQVSVI